MLAFIGMFDPQVLIFQQIKIFHHGTFWVQTPYQKLLTYFPHQAVNLTQL